VSTGVRVLSPPQDASAHNSGRVRCFAFMRGSVDARARAGCQTAR
jgi:hypothetical protein